MKKDKHKTFVRFLVNEREGETSDLFAYFPRINWTNNDLTKTCYSHIGQHSACSIEYAGESRDATPAEYADIKRELEGLGYNLAVLNSPAPIPEQTKVNNSR